MRTHSFGPLGASLAGLALGLSLLATPASAQLLDSTGHGGTPATPPLLQGHPNGGAPGGPGGWHGAGGAPGGAPGGWHGGGGQQAGGGGHWQGGGQQGYHGNNGGGWHGGGQPAYGGNNWGGHNHGYNRGYGYNHGYGYNNGYYNNGYNNGDWVAPAVGLGLLGGAIAGSVYANENDGVAYDAPAVGGDTTAYCMNRFKSYDPASGTYLGYDGLRHPCP